MILLNYEQALALRCGNKLVNIGDHKLKVISLCGEPEYRETREIHFPAYCFDNRYYNNGNKFYYRNNYRYEHNNQRNFSNHVTCQYQTIDVWIYNLGPQRFMREILFRDGIIFEINTLDYGY